MNWADMNRIFEASCMFILRRYTRPSCRLRVQGHHHLAEQQPVLGAAEGEDVHAGVAGERPQRHLEVGGRVRQPGAVHVELHALGMDVVGDGADLVRRVAGAQFGGLGDGDGQRLGAVLVAPAPGFPVNQLGGQLAVGRWAPAAA